MTMLLLSEIKSLVRIDTGRMCRPPPNGIIGVWARLTLHNKLDRETLHKTSQVIVLPVAPTFQQAQYAVYVGIPSPLQSSTTTRRPRAHSPRKHSYPSANRVSEALDVLVYPQSSPSSSTIHFATRKLSYFRLESYHPPASASAHRRSSYHTKRKTNHEAQRHRQIFR